MIQVKRLKRIESEKLQENKKYCSNKCFPKICEKRDLDNVTSVLMDEMRILIQYICSIFYFIFLKKKFKKFMFYMKKILIKWKIKTLVEIKKEEDRDRDLT
jgi:hypothetical protein